MKIKESLALVLLFFSLNTYAERIDSFGHWMMKLEKINTSQVLKAIQPELVSYIESSFEGFNYVANSMSLEEQTVSDLMSSYAMFAGPNAASAYSCRELKFNIADDSGNESTESVYFELTSAGNSIETDYKYVATFKSDEGLTYMVKLTASCSLLESNRGTPNFKEQ
ncbi:MAG: hypothetical protein CL677_05670 [Bdellovibrionaceae bacterium]|nr:hypothetical protein [Pseudobdellovibrionaceae bacterium]|tara:strand:- start:411 stop:911 length:501 start_codon:yes stop_codon:yes gene_type:complete